MLPAVLFRSWAELSVTVVGLNVNFALSDWLDIHVWKLGTTPVAYWEFVEASRRNVLPGGTGPSKTPPSPSPDPLMKTAMLPLWQ